MNHASLIIDGEFLLSHMSTVFTYAVNENIITALIHNIAFVCNSHIDYKYFFIAREHYKNSEFIDWKKANVEVDVRNFKNKTVICPHCNKSMVRRVEAEVDVAIAIRMAREVFRKKHPIDTIILIGGNRDFNDAIDLARHNGIRVTLLGDDSSISVELQQKQGVNLLCFLKDILIECAKKLDPVIPQIKPKEESKKEKPKEITLGFQSTTL